jgi:lipopolysaccharide/colanic/teichoic acid biosynthesis glycosyltransferase
MSPDPNPIQPQPEMISGARAIPRWKRVLDILLIIAALPLLLPMMLFIAMVVRCLSAGPVLFRQNRVGHHRKQFPCFKFRTMIVGNNTAGHEAHLKTLMDSNVPMTKLDLKGDPRIIPMGVILRASGLDELPQLFNVIAGHMSLVGPRPCLPYEAAGFDSERFNVVPGLTGLWQVSGKNNTTFEKMMELDIRYARTCSLWLDIRIIVKTIPALVIQMLETRRRKKLAALSAQSVHAEAAPSIAPAAPKKGPMQPITSSFKTVIRTDHTR